MANQKAPDSAAVCLLRDGFDRILQGIEVLLDGAEPRLLSYRPTPNSNHMAWLIWHLSRVQDDHFAHLANALRPDGEVEQCWISDGWFSRFGLPYEALDTGYGHTSGQVEDFGKFESEELLGYHRAVQRFSGTILDSLEDGDFGTVIDRRWDPPVTAGVRLVSVLNETAMHLGQAEFVGGVFADRR